jgi:ribosomal-protein-serine acetyltransferase
MTITIRPYAVSDAPAFLEAARESSAEVFPWLVWCHADYTLAEAETWIASQVEAFEKRTEFQFVIEEVGRLVGSCGLNHLSELHRLANLGYWLRTSAAGRGIMPQAVRLVADWAFANTNLERLEIVVAVGNTRSQRVAEKAGAVREGILRSRLFFHDRPHDAVMYSLVRPVTQQTERVSNAAYPT